MRFPRKDAPGANRNLIRESVNIKLDEVQREAVSLQVEVNQFEEEFVSLKHEFENQGILNEKKEEQAYKLVLKGQEVERRIKQLGEEVDSIGQQIELEKQTVSLQQQTTKLKLADSNNSNGAKPSSSGESNPIEGDLTIPASVTGLRRIRS